MKRAKFDRHKRVHGEMSPVSFDDFEEPIYPLPRDEYELIDPRDGTVVKAVVQMADFSRRIIYFKVDWNSAYQDVPRPAESIDNNE